MTPSSSSSSANNVLDHPPPKPSSVSFGFTQDQYKNIMELLQEWRSTSNTMTNFITTTLWILDTGETDHITYRLASLIKHKHINFVSMTLSNDSQIIMFISINIELSSSLTIDNVLYTHNFHVNLISITKLITNHQCYRHFRANTCHIIQNHSKVAYTSYSLLALALFRIMLIITLINSRIPI